MDEPPLGHGHEFLVAAFPTGISHRYSEPLEEFLSTAVQV